MATSSLTSTSHKLDNIAVLITFIATSTLFLFYSPTTLFWRDSGEFIISAFYLDVAHPAGFPLYSQFTNLFTLLPFGPIAWRVNLASCTYATLFLIFSYFSICQFSRFLQLTNNALCTSLYFLFALSCFAAPVFLKQMFSAEVYLLNAAFIQLVFLLFLKYKATNDLRFIVSAAFISGIGIANHVTCILAFVAIFAVIFTNLKVAKLALLPVLVAGFLGAQVYFYIPVRSSANPPLNTGYANSIERFINLISNQRASSLTAITSQRQEKSASEQIARLTSDLTKDIYVLVEELGVYWLVLAGFGFILLLRHQTLIAILFAWIFFSHWYLFKRWPPDPWMPLFWIIGILSVSCCLILAKNVNKKLVLLACFSLLFASAVYKSPSIISNSKLAKSSNTPQKIAKNLLHDLSAGDFYLTEQAWFQLKYIQTIEGYRPDINLVYLRRVTNPELFEPLTILPDQKLIFSNLSDFTNYASKISNLVVEPNSITSSFYKKILLLDDHGQLKIVRNNKHQIQPEFLPKLHHQLTILTKQVQLEWQPLKFEATHYLQTQIENYGRLLRELNQINEAIKLYEHFCKEPGLCNSVLLNSLGLCYLELGANSQALEVFNKAMSLSTSKKLQIEKNIKITELKLKAGLN